LRAALAVAAAGILAGSSVQGQQRGRIVAEADSAFSAGNIALADSLYYIAVRYWPRDPQARAALGRYLGARGKLKPAIVLLEEARMFGGDPREIGLQLAPLYERLGEWRGLLTLPGSPLSMAERRRAAWLSENPFAMRSDGQASTMVGAPRGDTIARVSVRIGGKTVMAAMLGTDAGFTVGTQLAAGATRAFESDPTVVAFDSMTVAQARFANVPALIGPEASTLTFGAAALGRVMIVLDYGKARITITQTDAVKTDARYPLVIAGGTLRVLDGGRWVTLSEFAAAVARLPRTMVVDFAAGEVRVRP
jgi:hypothetical protein